ncbi:hypothetical protein [Winogradskyella sp.]|uniref:hypothetical protein n=1 Tax=Winogradskyella sp. TaxID=1883156 RepID=UPI003BA8F9E0
MKHGLVLLIVLGLFSCAEEQPTSLQALKINNVDNIPFLMIEMEIDSVFEIVTYGRYSSANVNDTVNRYVPRGNNTINLRHKSFMCCDNDYQYDSLGILKNSSVFTDYETNYSFSYKRGANTITVTETGTYNDSYTHIYTLENERIIAKSSTHNIDEDYSQEVRYFYNSEGQLIKRHSEAKNAPNDEFDYEVMLKAYAWHDSTLYETSLKQFYNDGQDFYETKTKFDADGFPASRTIMQNKDTICKTILIKIHTTK